MTLARKGFRASALEDVHDRLLEWFAPRVRAYPWRIRPTPYRVLVSEVMLQQTQAGRVVPHYRSFLKRFPSVRALAAAPLSDVIRAWSGLGYNRRAVALASAARAIVRDHGARVPPDPAALRRLPGIGPYTAAAVASLGHGLAVPLVETNVRRILSRAALGREPGDVSTKHLEEVATSWLDAAHPVEWNQALMDLGREVCRPAPLCDACPIRTRCRSAGRRDRPAATHPPQPRFEGSFRQTRGRVISVLSERGDVSVAALARATGEPIARLSEAIEALAADGLVRAGPAARAGAPRGRVRLAS
ncbi:MAG: A/G-specific adenine glycosylase [Actinomycetota bacterium]|nr:A/G-specific adenine glycosylase [Actinomycetota bacterium]